MGDRRVLCRSSCRRDTESGAIVIPHLLRSSTVWSIGLQKLPHRHGGGDGIDRRVLDKVVFRFWRSRGVSGSMVHANMSSEFPAASRRVGLSNGSSILLRSACCEKPILRTEKAPSRRTSLLIIRQSMVQMDCVHTFTADCKMHLIKWNLPDSPPFD